MISMNNNTAVLYDEKWFIIANENKKKKRFIQSIAMVSFKQRLVEKYLYIYDFDTHTRKMISVCWILIELF